GAARSQHPPTRPVASAASSCCRARSSVLRRSSSYDGSRAVGRRADDDEALEAHGHRIGKLSLRLLRAGADLVLPEQVERGDGAPAEAGERVVASDNERCPEPPRRDLREACRGQILLELSGSREALLVDLPDRREVRVQPVRAEMVWMKGADREAAVV